MGDFYNPYAYSSPAANYPYFGEPDNYVAPGSSGYNSSTPGFGMEGYLASQNVSPQQYQAWAGLTSGLNAQQLSDVMKYGTIAGGDVITGGLWNPPEDISSLAPWQVSNIFGAQNRMNSLASGYQQSQQATQQASQYQAARQAALSGTGGTPGYTPTQNPGINPITGAALGAAGGAAGQTSTGVPGLNLPANQPGNNFFAQDIGMAGPQGAAGSQAGVLNLYADLYGQGMNAVSQYGQAELGQLQNSYLQNSAAMQSQLRGAGLNNTTVGQSMQTGLSQSKDLALTNLNSQIGQYQTGVIGSLGTGVANAAQGLYSQQQGINAQATANQQNINAGLVMQQANAQAASQQQAAQIAANAAQSQNQFNYATALATQQFGYQSGLQAQGLNLQNQYQRQLQQLQQQQTQNMAQGGQVAGGSHGPFG